MMPMFLTLSSCVLRSIYFDAFSRSLGTGMRPIDFPVRGYQR